MSLLAAAPEAAAPEQHDTRQLCLFFKVMVREGPSNGLVAAGMLEFDITLRTGNFTGTLTPFSGEKTGGNFDLTPFLDKETGRPFNSVLFKQTEGGLVPDPSGVTQIDVRGTIRGHAINLVMLNVAGTGKDVFGVGTMENTLDDWLQAHYAILGGAAVGPEEGDSGDWRADEVP
jgi:hypothetical protein